MEDSHCGYPRSTLLKAFDVVCDPDDWRAPIDAEVAVEEVPVTVAAIEYFTATSVRVTRCHTDRCRVRSVGYRSGPAGP